MRFGWTSPLCVIGAADGPPVVGEKPAVAGLPALLGLQTQTNFRIAHDSLIGRLAADGPRKCEFGLRLGPANARLPASSPYPAGPGEGLAEGGSETRPGVSALS